MAKSPTPKPAEQPTLSRRQQFVQTYQMAKKSDPAIGRWVGGAGLLGSARRVRRLLGSSSVGSSTLGLILSVVGGLMVGVLAGLIVFSRRAQRAVYGQMEGQVGAAAGALGLLKRGWHVDNAIAFTKQQDVVHRVVGSAGHPPGRRGQPRAAQGPDDLRAQAPRAGRPDTPVHEIVVGNADGQVPLAKLSRHVQKMKRQVQPAEITDILARLKAIDASRPDRADAEGPGAHLDEGHARPDARPLSDPRPVTKGGCARTRPSSYAGHCCCGFAFAVTAWSSAPSRREPNGENCDGSSTETGRRTRPSSLHSEACRATWCLPLLTLRPPA